METKGNYSARSRGYRWADLSRILVLASFYALLAGIVLTIATANGNVTIFWLPGGFALAVLLSHGVKYWPGVYIGAVAAGAMVDDPFGVSQYLALGNTLETLAVCWLLGHCTKFDIELARTRDYIALAWAGAAGSVISALIGPFALMQADYLTPETVFKNVFHWWQGDVLGIILGAPLFLIWRNAPRDWIMEKNAAMIIVFFLMAFLAGQVVFLGWFKNFVGEMALGYWFFLLVVLAAVNYGRHGASILIGMAALQALQGAISGAGFFAADIEKTGLQNFWAYLLVLSGTGYLLALNIEERKRLNALSRDSELKWRALFSNMTNGFILNEVIRDAEGQVVDFRFLEMNEPFEAMTGLTRSRLIGKRFREVFPDTQIDWVETYKDVVITGNPKYLENYSTELQRWFSAYAYRSGPDQFVELLQDITERKRVEEELKLAASVYQNSSEAMAVTDDKNRIIAVNPAFTELTGYRFDEVCGKYPKILSSGRQTKEFYQAMWDALNTSGHWEGEIWNRRKNGEEFIELLIINTIYKEDGSVGKRVALFSDITEKKRSEVLIWNQANFDPLTQLPNRRLFYDRLNQEIKKARRDHLRLALLFLDLDRFKDVNDTLGHAMGDELLIEAARRIRDCVRDSDTVARLGGDEFTVILTELSDAVDLKSVFQSIIECLNKPFQLGEDFAYVSVSIGVTIYPDDADNAESLLVNADQAMYTAKHQGRNRYCYFTRSMQENAQERARLSNDLHLALQSGQMQVYYQPIVELLSGDVYKAEALLRWFHPEQGLVNPSRFIPIAEETGAIGAIGDWVFRQAARQVKEWQHRYGIQFQVGVNKSPVQFQSDARHLHPWTDYLEELGIDGSSIVVEITEGLLLNASEHVTRKLLKFRDAGVQVAIDDFGTGYSSLSYLQLLEFDALKIDKSFISGIDTTFVARGARNGAAIVNAIIVLGHQLGYRIVAEGVETQEQCDWLKRIGCDVCQGFFFSRPVPVEDFENRFLRAPDA